MGCLKNPRHERFALLVAGGKTQADAYRSVFPNCKRSKPGAIHVMASKLAVKVATRVKELLEASAARASITKDEAVSILAEGLRATPGDVKDTSRFAQEMTIDPVTGRVTIRLPSKTALFSELSKALGWYAPVKSEVAVAMPAHDDVQSLLKERLAAIRSKKK